MTSNIDPLSLWLLLLSADALAVVLAGLPLLGLWWLLVEKNSRETNRELAALWDAAPGQLDAKPTLRPVDDPPRRPASHRGGSGPDKPPCPPAPRVRPPLPDPLDGEARPESRPPDPSATTPGRVYPAPYPLPGGGVAWDAGRAQRDRARHPGWPFGEPFPVTPDTDGGTRA